MLCWTEFCKEKLEVVEDKDVEDPDLAVRGTRSLKGANEDGAERHSGLDMMYDIASR
jgi:hypothetical protein